MSKEAEEFKGIKVIILGVVLLIAGFWLKEQVIISTQSVEIIPGYPVTVPSYTSLNPYGWLLVAIGAAVAILGIWMWTLPMRGLKVPIKEAPKVKVRKQKIVEVVEINHTSRLMTDLKFGILFIVAGFLIRLLLVHVIAKEYADVGTIISIGDWLLVLFAAIGILGIGYGVVEYAIAKKRK